MTYYQSCCTLVAVILAVAIHIDPVVNYIFTQPVTFIRRFTFAIFYYAVTFPPFLYWLTMSFPMTAIVFYAWLIDTSAKMFPEFTDDQ